MNGATFAQTGLGIQGGETLGALACDPTVSVEELLHAVQTFGDFFSSSIATGEVAPEAARCFSASIPLLDRRASIARWDVRQGEEAPQ